MLGHELSYRFKIPCLLYPSLFETKFGILPMEAHKIDIFSCGKSQMDTTTLIINMKLSTLSIEKTSNE
jgi:hypothetical protein